MLTLSNYPNIQDGIRKVLRAQDVPLQEYQQKWNADVFDILDAVDIARLCVPIVTRTVGVQLHQTNRYDFTADIKNEVEENILSHKDEKQSLLMRKMYLTPYHMIIEPMIDALGSVDQDQALIEYNQLFDDVSHAIMTFTDYGSVDDAVVAKHQIKSMVKVREEHRRTQKINQKKANRSRKKMLKELESLPEIDNSLVE